MTISSDIRKAGPYSANGATVTFPFSFKCFSTADVQVVLTNASDVETVLTLTSQYTVALNADQNTSPGGSITTVATYASGNKITIVGDVDYQQNTDITNGGGFYPEVIENALDKVTMQMQQIKEQVDRSAKLPVSSTEDADALVADLVRLADSAANIDTVAGSIANVNAVGSDIANVNAVAGNAANINAVSGNAANINAVAANGADIDTVAANIADIDTVVANIVDIQNAQENAALVVNATTQAVDGEKDLFVAGVGYTKNVTTQLTLTYTPAKSGTVKVFFDGVYQNLTEWSLVGKVITFTAAIPADQVEVTYEIASQLVGLSNADLLVLGAAQADAQASATLATTQAGLAATEAASASGSKVAAETARDIAQNSSRIYATTAAGLAATTNGQYFYVPQAAPSGTILDLYVNNSGTALYVNNIPASGAIADMTEQFIGSSAYLIVDGLPSNYSRGTYDTAGTNVAGTLFGWASPFTHNGVAFNTIQTHIRGNAAGRLRVEICKGSAPLAPIAYGFVEVTTTARIATIVLNKTVRDLANGDVAYIRIYDPNKVIGVYYRSATGRLPGDPSSASYSDQYFLSSGWSNTTPVDAYRIDFRVFNTASYYAVTRPLLNSSNELINCYVPYVSYQSVLGDAEMTGNASYSGVAKSIGFFEQVSEQTLFNAMSGRVWATDPTANIEWKVWIRDTAVGFNMQSTAAVASGTIFAGSFPTVDNIYTLKLPTPVLVPSGKFVFVSFRPANDTTINARRWTYDASVTPARHGFTLAVGNGWNTNLGFSDPGAGFGQVAIKLLMESEELRATSIAGNNISYSNSASQLAAITAQAAIDELAYSEMVVPPFVFGVQSREANVYFDNLFFDDSSEYAIEADSSASLGTQQEERWTWIPAGSVTSGTLTIKAIRKNTGLAITTKTIGHRAAASSAGSGLNKKVIVIGDSLVGAGVITQTLLDVAGTDVMGITLLGTLGSGSNKHEGRGGWTVNAYTTNYSDGTYGTNPFWIGGAVNFPQYLTNSSIAVPDWVFIHLGINDVGSTSTDASAISLTDAALTKMDTLIASILAAGAGVKVGIMISTPGSRSQDAFGNNYGVGLTGWRFKRNILIWAKRVIAKYAGQEASRIYLVPSNTALDTVNNMSRAAAAPVNSRNAAVTVTRQNNGVHPATSGYQQIADAVWAFLKYYA